MARLRSQLLGELGVAECEGGAHHQREAGGVVRGLVAAGGRVDLGQERGRSVAVREGRVGERRGREAPDDVFDGAGVSTGGFEPVEHFRHPVCFSA